jgi:hypothetical protein
MKNQFTPLMLALSLVLPSASLWAAAGDSSLQGSGATTTGTPAPKAKKHHGGHHKKNKPAATTSTPDTSNTTGTK